jgi:hypothetical protein
VNCRRKHLGPAGVPGLALAQPPQRGPEIAETGRKHKGGYRIQHSACSPSGGTVMSQTPAPIRVRVHGPDSVIAIVPRLLGFHPDNSLVVLGFGSPHLRIRLAFRYDLPGPGARGVSQDIAAHATNVLTREHLTMAILIGYGDARAVTSVTDVVIPALTARGIIVHDALRVHQNRYWSRMCAEPSCCPPEGVPCDPDRHPAAAALAAAGLTVHMNRATLAGTLAREPESVEPMAEAIERAKQRAVRLTEEALSHPDQSDLMRPVADAGRRSVRRAVTGSRSGTKLTDHDELAWLGFTLTDLRVRDDAWARMDPQFHHAHQQLWRQLVRTLPDEFIPAPAALLAFTAWQAGDGALASIAIDRALAADPGYSMATLIADALHAGLPPSAAKLSMTPKQVAASYHKQHPRS